MALLRWGLTQKSAVLIRRPLIARLGRTLTKVSTVADTDLAVKMIARADTDNLPHDHEIRTRAAAFDEAAKGFYSDPQTCDVKRFVGCWARARRTWCDYTGEVLI